MTEFIGLTEDSRRRWNDNAVYWDSYMGDESNSFHRELVRPKTEELLMVGKDQKVLDIACGNGNFSRHLVELGAKVVAFDFSNNMIECAKKRSSDFSDKIEFKVMDATKYEDLISLGTESFDAAVANMALMDIAEIEPLLKAVYHLLKPKGVFVFSIMHPCFQTPGMRKVYEEEETGGRLQRKRIVETSRYIIPETYEGIGIRNQPAASRYFHRPLSVLLKECFKVGFVLDGMEEPTFDRDKYDINEFWVELPPVIILRLRK